MFPQLHVGDPILIAYNRTSNMRRSKNKRTQYPSIHINTTSILCAGFQLWLVFFFSRRQLIHQIYVRFMLCNIFTLRSVFGARISRFAPYIIDTYINVGIIYATTTVLQFQVAFLLCFFSFPFLWLVPQTCRYIRT